MGHFASFAKIFVGSYFGEGIVSTTPYLQLSWFSMASRFVFGVFHPCVTIIPD
jgi:hypothetical protein